MSLGFVYERVLIVAFSFSQTSTLEFSVDSADVSHSGDYVCLAINRQGSAEEKISVRVKPQPLSVEIPNVGYSPTENQTNFEIPCNIWPQRKVQLTWLFDGKPLDDELIHVSRSSPKCLENSWLSFQTAGSNLIIQKVLRRQQGIYTCSVQTQTEQKSVSTHLTVLYPARLIDAPYEGAK